MTGDTSHGFILLQQAIIRHAGVTIPKFRGRAEYQSLVSNLENARNNAKDKIRTHIGRRNQGNQAGTEAERKGIPGFHRTGQPDPTEGATADSPTTESAGAAGGLAAATDKPTGLDGGIDEPGDRDTQGTVSQTAGGLCSVDGTVSAASGDGQGLPGMGEPVRSSAPGGNQELTAASEITTGRCQHSRMMPGVDADYCPDCNKSFVHFYGGSP